MRVDDKELSVKGKVLRIACVAEGYEFVDQPAAFLEALREVGSRVDLFTFIQRISDPTPRFSYATVPDNTAAIHVSSYDDWFTKQINKKTRNMLRKAEKSGVSARELPFDDTLVSAIAAINNESPVRQSRTFIHYDDDLETVRRMNGTFQERTVFLGAFFQDQIIGYAKLTRDETSSQAGLMQILSMMKHRDKAPTNVLIAQAVRTCADRGISHLWYARMSYGQKPLDGLAAFKQRNGFEEVEVRRYFVPLTMRGQLALRCGLQDGIAAYVPSSLLDGARELRNRWFSTTTGRVEKARQG